LESADNAPFLERLKQFINHDEFLPSGVKLHDISSQGVVFKDGNGIEVQVENLSDGFRSILSMTLELIRQLSFEFKDHDIFSPDGNKIVASGVVVFSEIDVHLHPTWQQQIGQWFCDHFPNIQFIVTTHSPLVCQSAEQGSIFVLPEIGSDDFGHMLEGEELHRVLYGNVLDAYGTEAFGKKAATTRSESSQDLSRELSKLNNKEVLKGLSAQEKQEQLRIKGMLPSKQGRDH
jgi:predicted ATP-binding protein involved in virulence